MQIERGKRMAGSVTVRHVANKQSATSSKSSALPLVEKDACNCLCCGKIYMTRLDNDDVRQFLSKSLIINAEILISLQHTPNDDSLKEWKNRHPLRWWIKHCSMRVLAWMVLQSCAISGCHLKELWDFAIQDSAMCCEPDRTKYEYVQRYHLLLESWDLYFCVINQLSRGFHAINDIITS